MVQQKFGFKINLVQKNLFIPKKFLVKKLRFQRNFSPKISQVRLVGLG